MKTQTTIKSIDWSYPTSPNAEKFGFKKGCFTVSISRDRITPPKGIKAFSIRNDAVEYAETIPGQWRSVRDAMMDGPKYAAPESSTIGEI